MKRILGIVASPRKMGNTESLVKIALEATGQENVKEMIRLNELNIKGCRACYSCLPEDVPCVIDDDLHFVLGKIRSADAVILAAPCYILGPNSSIKVFTDRLFSAGSKYKQYAGKRCVTITTYGYPGWDGIAEALLNLTARFLNLNLVDSDIFLGASPGEVLENPQNIERAKQLGKALVDLNYKRIPNVNECPVCWSDLLKYDGENVKCPFCGTKGKIEIENNVVRLVFDKEIGNRFMDEGREHFKVFLKKKKEEFIAKKEYIKKLQETLRSINYWVAP